MSTQAGEFNPASRSSSWRTPAVIILCGCAIGMLGFGPRSALGFFVQPMSHEFAWGRDVFGLAIAVQNLLWGLGQPLAGAIADRFGLFRVMCVGAFIRCCVTPRSTRRESGGRLCRNGNCAKAGAHAAVKRPNGTRRH